jgi:hypothetical protein
MIWSIPTGPIGILIEMIQEIMDTTAVAVVVFVAAGIEVVHGVITTTNRTHMVKYIILRTGGDEFSSITAVSDHFVLNFRCAAETETIILVIKLDPTSEIEIEIGNGTESASLLL